MTAKLLSDDRWRRVLLIEAGDASQTELGGKVGAIAVSGPQISWRIRRSDECAFMYDGYYTPQQAIQSPHNVHELTMFDIPFFWTRVANTPELHWDYPDVNIAKALGGCGIHNAMLYGEPPQRTQTASDIVYADDRLMH